MWLGEEGSSAHPAGVCFLREIITMPAMPIVLAVAIAAIPIQLQVGKQLPAFQATDLDGKPRSAQELVGRPTAIIVTPSRGAGTQSGTWAQLLSNRAGSHSVHIVGLVALDVPFFIPQGMVQNVARSHVPKKDWDDTWLSVKGDLRRRLGIERGSPTPYVFSLDASGKITAVVHGPPTTENLQEIAGGLAQATRRRRAPTPIPPPACAPTPLSP